MNNTMGLLLQEKVNSKIWKVLVSNKKMKAMMKVTYNSNNNNNTTNKKTTNSNNNKWHDEKIQNFLDEKIF